MNPILDPVCYSFIASAALGISLAFLPQLHKTVLRWLGTGAIFTLVNISLTAASVPADFMPPAALLAIHAGNLIGPVIYFALAMPGTRAAKATALLILLTACTLGGYHAIKDLLKHDTIVPLPPQMDEPMKHVAQEALKKSLHIKLVNLPNQTSPDYSQTPVQNDFAAILEKFVKHLITTKQLGPCYVAELAGNPIIETIGASQTTTGKNPTPVDCLIAKGSAEISVTITAAYYKEGKPTADKPRTLMLTIPFRAVFTMEQDIPTPVQFSTIPSKNDTYSLSK